MHHAAALFAHCDHIFLCVVALCVILPLHFLLSHGVFHHATTLANGICSLCTVLASKLCCGIGDCGIVSVFFVL